MILWLVETAASIGLDYVYLGYWIEACDKMSYKTRYRPIELLGDAGWETL
jgi:arginine-tRNA-protein transferase